jgi:hypothetical protein
MLACSTLVPDGWVQVPLPEETYDFENPTVFLPLLLCMAPYGAVVFTVAARPAFGDGTVQDWAEYLARENSLQVERVREARVSRLPCVLVDATMPSEVGVMRSRSILLEDGGRLYNVGTLAPETIWPSVEADFDRLLGSFELAETKGFTAAPMRLVTSEPSLDLSAGPSASSLAGTSPAASATPAADASGAGAEATSEAAPADAAVPDAEVVPDDTPTEAADVAIADDAATLDPEHQINANLRDNGVGLVPRVVAISYAQKFATVAAAAIEQTFHIPFGWHVIDDGKRTLVFDPAGGVQINLSLRHAAADALPALLSEIAEALARESADAQFVTLELRGMPCLGVRDLVIDGEKLDQAYLARPSHREGLALVCRVTADRENITRALNTAEVILMSLQGPIPPDPEFAGQPDWWRAAVLLERANRLEEAEKTILDALDHIGVYSSLARLYEERYARLLRAGREEEATAARERAVHWLTVYASSATSGGEGAALSRERDQRISALGGPTA